MKENKKQSRLEIRTDDEFNEILADFSKNNDDMPISDIIRFAVSRLVDDMTVDDLIKFQDLYRCPNCKKLPHQ